MERQIIVPLDGSDRAAAILPQAVQLAHAFDGGLTLLQVIHPPHAVEMPMGAFPTGALALETYQLARAAAHQYLNGWAQHLAPSGLTVHTVVLDGDPATALSAYIAEQPASTLVAMATHGRQGLERLVFGSVAEQVLHTAVVPVLLAQPSEAALPQSPALPSYRRILVPLDGSTFAEEALERAQALAVRTGATLLLVSALPSSADVGMVRVLTAPGTGDPFLVQVDEVTNYLADLARHLEAQDLVVETYGHFGDPAEVILQVIHEAHPDLIVMATHGRSGFQQWRLGSVALRIVHEAGRPVLLVRPAPLAAPLAELTATHHLPSPAAAR